ncbi:Glycosyltransferase involved in cell wall bisynthesis [Hymenobacter gelipurpurascens]|uniref:Glycosyltransferase involved in cell wall bisynthesis n=1 Tax=Hymenobacter gelipurpurascens TaxID=89968 RepID=A0A212TNY7_9BACT|nr:glycosyltransferase [Hymenobacter gelipurpurascens]SNC67739.1 Glycosyltransferase involved in cell wall bisynthesis [Hymenobacter gelipurpurascens]
MIKVSVCTITYNHGPYIAQTIEGVLEQRCPELEIEMIIGDDVSSDNTREIVADYARRFPDNIKPLFHEKNLGPGANTRACMAACTGKYIAALEGDDYWTDPQKLLLQVEALEARPDCGMSFHDADTFNSTDGSIEWTFGEEFPHILPPAGSAPKTYSQLDFARYGWFVPTASMLFRTASLPLPLPDWFEGVYSGDYTLQLLSTKYGPAIYLPRVMSRYRIHHTGLGNIMAQSADKFKRRIFEAKMFQEHVFRPKDKKHADIYLAMQYKGYARYLLSQGQRWEPLLYRAKGLFYDRQRLAVYLERRLQQANTSQN